MIWELRLRFWKRLRDLSETSRLEVCSACVETNRHVSSEPLVQWRHGRPFSCSSSLRCVAHCPPSRCTHNLIRSAAHACLACQWKGRTIYQLLTDRFARADGSTESVAPAPSAGELR
jgi:hypothetical protein